MSPEAFADRFGVSRETTDRLQVYVEVLKRWNPRINLVSPASLPEVWTRHLADSAQLLDHAPTACTWLDLGSGAGLPGLVIAALRPDLRVTLVDSDQRKAAFLRTAANAMGVPVAVEARRIEALAPWAPDVVSARALAPLPRLLDLAAPFLGPGTTGLFLKGARVESELTALDPAWHSRVEQFPSITEAQGRIVRIRASRQCHGNS